MTVNFKRVICYKLDLKLPQFISNKKQHQRCNETTTWKSNFKEQNRNTHFMEVQKNETTPVFMVI